MKIKDTLMKIHEQYKKNYLNNPSNAEDLGHE